MSNKKPCSCIREDFAIHVTSIDDKKMLLHDLSDWVVDDGFSYPDIFNITLVFPNSSEKEFQVGKNGSVLYGDFKDGLYVAKIDNCGVKYSQNFLYTASCQCKIDNILAENLPKNKELIKDIQDDIAVAKASAKIGAFSTATSILEKTKIKLSNISCNCNC